MSILYWVMYPQAGAKPTAVQVRSGQQASGAAATSAGNQTATLSGVGVFTWTTPATGGTPGAFYKFAAVTDLGNDASVVESAAWQATPSTITGGMATSELLDVAAFSGARTYAGTLAVTEARDVAAFAGTMIPKFHTGTLAGTETQIDVFAASGTVGPPTGRFGDLAALEQRDVAAFAGARTFFGTLAAVETRDVAAFAGTMIPTFVSGTLAAEESRDISTITGTATTGVPVTGALVAVEQRDVAAFAGAKTYFGTLATTEARDNAAFVGFITNFVTGTLAAVEPRDRANFSSNPVLGVNFVVLRDANTGLNVSPEQQWRDGAPSYPGTLLPTQLGNTGILNNFTNRRDSQRRQARIVQAPQDTQALVDIVPGFYAFIDVKAGEWVWCLSRDNAVADADNPIGQDDVVV